MILKVMVSIGGLILLWIVANNAASINNTITATATGVNDTINTLQGPKTA